MKSGQHTPKNSRAARLLLAFVAAFGLSLSVVGQEKTPPPPSQTTAPPPAPRKSNSRPAAETSAIEPYDQATVAQMAEKCVRLETGAGVIDIEMLPGAAPETVRNFLNLTAISFFDTTTFNRTVKGFVVQGGSIATRETHSPALMRRAARTIIDEPNNVKHERGVVSMARAEAPNSATTHFFILVGAAPHLDNKFAAFGRVVSGLEVVDAINAAPAENEKPAQPVSLKRATITPACSPAPPPTP
ncbi:MAG TPA: peptidylprolyl isomerase [Pyrinomonadaceae bacterium]|nr:peptidylprolyl isomerase [Pyrinomonadaceae bacterium]